jgi:hypothetical protein
MENCIAELKQIWARTAALSMGHAHMLGKRYAVREDLCTIAGARGYITSVGRLPTHRLGLVF